jgi:hypothetical protein
MTGRYLLQVTLSSVCNASRAPMSFPMDASPAGASPHPGVQVLLNGDPATFEIEAIDDGQTVRGGLGTTGDGALSNEGLRVWIHAVGGGRLSRGLGGRGEVPSGTLMGYVAWGNADDEEGGLGSCSAADHTFSLRAQ